MANRFWVGGTGNWDTTTTTNWSTTSGGAGGASAPTAADDVFINANSGTGTITVVTGALCKSLNTTGSSSSLTMGGGTLTCSGSVTNPAGSTVIGGVSFSINGTGTISIDSSFQSLTVNGVGITVTLGANLTTTQGVTVQSGTFNASTFNVTTKILNSGGSTARTISMGSGTWTLTGSAGNGELVNTSTVVSFSGSNLTVNGNTSTISLTNAGQFQTITFNGLSKTFYNLSIDGGANPLELIITGANTFNQISETMSVPYIVTFPASSTTTVTTLALTGAINNPATLRSSTLGTTATLAVTNTFTADYLSVNSVSLSAANIGTVTNGYIQESTNWGLGSGSKYYQAVTATGLNTVTLPASWTNNNEVHLFGAGGGGSGGISNGTDAVSGGAGGGGGGYSKLTNIASAASSTVYCEVGVGGVGGTGSTVSVASAGTTGGNTTFGTSIGTITSVAASENSGSGGSVTVTKPTGTVDGDLMIAFLSATGSGSNNFSTLSGWTNIFSAQGGGGGGPRMNIQYKYASSEGANYTFSGANSTTTYGVILTYRNATYDTVGAGSTYTQNPTSPAINVALNNALLFDFINGTANSQTYTTPSGFSLIDSQSLTPPFAIYSKSVNSGTTGTVANTSSGGTNQSVLLSIFPSLNTSAIAGGGAGGSSTTTTSVGGTGGTASGGSVNYTGGAGGTGSVGTGGGTSSARGGGGGGGCAGLNGNGGAGGNGSGSTTDNKNCIGGGGGGASGGFAGGNAVANTSSGSGGNNFLNFGGSAGYTTENPNNTPLGNGTYGAGGRGTWGTTQASGSISLDLVANIFSAAGGSGDRGITNNVGTAYYGAGGGGGASQRTNVKDGSVGGNGLVVFTWGSASTSSGNFFFLFM